MKVSVIMPCYNSQSTLEESITSVISQTYQNWELIFWDNCSTDSSVSIVKSFQDPRIQIYTCQQTDPLSIARNNALKHCKGKYICFLDSDDLWFPDKLTEQVEVHEEDSDLMFSYTAGFTVDETGSVIGEFNPVNSSGNTGSLLRRYDVVFSSSMIKRSESIYFDTILKYCPDYDLFLRLSVLGNFKCLPNKLCSYRVHSDSLSQTLKSRWSIETKYIINKLIVIDSSLLDSYSNDFRYAAAISDYYMARFLKESHHNSLLAFPFLFKNVFVSYKFLFLSFLVFLPRLIWVKVLNFKFKRSH